MIRKTKNNTFIVDVSIDRKNRHRKTLKTKQDAIAYERYFLARLENNKDWKPKAKDTRSMLEILELWYKLHGEKLRDGKRRCAILENTIKEMNNPMAINFSANDFSHYRANISDKYKPKTINNKHTYISSMYNELKRLGEIDYNNPLALLRTIKIPERELSYLEKDEEKLLFKELSKYPDTYYCACICLACGTRWGEAKALTKENIKNGKIALFNTKNGKNRFVPIQQNLAQELLKRDLPLKANKDIFTNAYKDSKIRKIEGQSTHILRHTYASRFMMNGGNVTTLQKILGHSTINMTMRYSHLSPEHLQDALKFAPIVKMLS